MTSLVTASLLRIAVVLCGVGAVGALGCDSNPTPHPERHGGHDASGSMSGDVTGTRDPGHGTDEPGTATDNDNDPSSGKDDDAAYGEACPPFVPADAVDGADAAQSDAGPDISDAHADDNDTTESSDCGPDTAPTPSAPSDNQVE